MVVKFRSGTFEILRRVITVSLRMPINIVK